MQDMSQLPLRSTCRFQQGPADVTYYRVLHLLGWTTLQQQNHLFGFPAHLE